MKFPWLAGALALTFGLLARPAQAVEEGEIKIIDRWSVVGVIVGEQMADQTVGIAVLRNNQTKRTFTLSIGDAVPTEFGFVLKAVRGKIVEISNGKQTLTLPPVEGSAATDEAEAQTTRTTRFLESYYRGLGDTETQEGETGSTLMPLRRFGTLQDEAKSRYELYRADKTYRTLDDAPPGDPENGGFVVNYDNFDEESLTSEEDEGRSAPTSLEDLPMLPPPLVVGESVEFYDGE